LRPCAESSTASIRRPALAVVATGAAGSASVSDGRKAITCWRNLRVSIGLVM
jgi:hypothetical protein